MRRKKLYNTGQAARELGVGRDTLYRWMRDKKVKGARIVRVGGDVEIQFRLWTEKDLNDVRKYMTENYHKGRGRKKQGLGRG